MISVEVFPLVGVSDLRFGQKRPAVRAVKRDRASFRRGASSVLTDAYGEVFLEYDDRDTLRAIELASPAPATLGGIRLLGRLCDEVLADLRAAGHVPVEMRSGAGSAGWALPALGIVLGQSLSEGNDGFASILVSSRPYKEHAFEIFEGVGGGLGESIEVVPHEGFGPVRLGASREDMRRLLGGGIGSTPDFGAAWQDNFFSRGVVLSYDSQWRVIRAALTGSSPVSCSGIQLLGRPYRALWRQARNQGMRVEHREAELVFQDHGFGVLTLRTGDELPTVAVVMSRTAAGPELRNTIA